MIIANLFEEDGAVQSFKVPTLNLQEECLAQGYFRWIIISNPITRVAVPSPELLTVPDRIDTSDPTGMFEFVFVGLDLCFTTCR